MPQILVWECPKTGKFFKTKRGYLNHLKKVAEANLAVKKEQRAIAAAAQLIADAQEKLVTFEEIADFVKHNVGLSIQHALIRCTPDWYSEREKERFRNFAIESINFAYMRYSLHISNSHSAPKGKITNWSRDRNITLGYPGWYGTVKIKTNGERHAGFGSDLLNPFGIHTGSGGGDHNTFEYQVIFWEDDWPGLKRQQVWNILKDV